YTAGGSAGSAVFNLIWPRLSGRSWYAIIVKPDHGCRPSCGRSALNGEIEHLMSGEASSGRVRANSAAGEVAIAKCPFLNIMYCSPTLSFLALLCITSLTVIGIRHLSLIGAE